MTVDLPLLSWAVAGTRPDGLPGRRTCPLPPPGLHPRRPRLPGLAEALANLALSRPEVPRPSSVLFGTAFGCLTETGAFVENRILKEEALPLPRAFSVSVHNAVASRMAMALGARGENTTFVHGEVSFFQALLAAGLLRRRGEKRAILVGGADEATEYVTRARAACGGEPPAPAGEGGGVLLCGDPPPGLPALAVIREVSLGRARSPGAWVSRQLSGRSGLDLLIVIAKRGPETAAGAGGAARTIDGRSWTGDHPSAPAAATALAAGAIAGEIGPEVLGLPGALRSIAVLAATCYGDVGLTIIERAP